MEAPIETIRRENAVVFGLNEGTLVVESVTGNQLVLTGEPASGSLSTGSAVLARYQDQWYLRRILSSSHDGNRWTLTVEPGDFPDVYSQYGFSTSADMTVASTETDSETDPSGDTKPRVDGDPQGTPSNPNPDSNPDSNPNPNPEENPDQKKAAPAHKWKPQIGVSFGAKLEHEIKYEHQDCLRDGRRYERHALVGELAVVLEAEASVRGVVSSKDEWRIQPQIGVPVGGAITVKPVGALYYNAEACIYGKVNGSLKHGTVFASGFERFDGGPKKNIRECSGGKTTVDYGGEGGGYLDLRVGAKVLVEADVCGGVVSAALGFDAYGNANIEWSPSKPGKATLGFGLDAVIEANLLKFGGMKFEDIKWFDFSLGWNMAIPLCQYPIFKWTGPEPDFDYSPADPQSPCYIEFLDRSKGDRIAMRRQNGYMVEEDYQVDHYEWDLDGTPSTFRNPALWVGERHHRVLHISQKVQGKYFFRNFIVAKKDVEVRGEYARAKYRREKWTGKGGSTQRSSDPNEMVGPEGKGEKRLVKPGEWMDYTVYFENKEGADIADAQEVWVTNPMSEYLDWSTFEMGEVAFNNQIDLGLDGFAAGASEIALEGTRNAVRTEVSVDENGIVRWYLRIVDPEAPMGWPTDGSGFLPSNDATHRGEGHLSYRVKVRDDAPVGVRIDNSASIVFDYNAAIETNPAWWNTVGIPGVAFGDEELLVDEGSNLVFTVNGGSVEKAASVQVYLTYQTAAAADIDLAKGTVRDGEGAVATQKGGLKFPLTLNWAAGETGPKTITIPVKTDKTVEDDETLVFQLANAQGQELGETTVCQVTIRDANVAADYAAKQAKETVKTKKGVETEALEVACVAGDGSGDVCGYTTGQGKYSKGSKASLKATARPGWEFTGWGEVVRGGALGDRPLPDGVAVTNIVSDKASWNVTLTNDAEIVAVFGRVPYVAGLATPADGGKVSGSGYCAAGKKVTLKATVNKNFAFVGWVVDPSGGLIEAALPIGDGMGVIATPTLVFDRSAKPAKSDAKQTVITNVSESVTYYAVFKSDPTVFVYLASDDNASAPGKVTGAGKYAAGKTKIALKATANKGYVFAGWWEGAVSGGRGATALPDGEPLSRAASYTLSKMPTNDVELTAVFITAATDKANIAASVNGMAFPVRSDGDVASPLATNIWTGVYLEWPVAASALSETTVKVAGLPNGLKFAAKDVTQKIGSGKTAQTVVVVPANTIYGAPSAASKVDKNGKATPSQVKVTVTTAGKSSQTYQIDTTVDPLPTWAQGTFVGGWTSDEETVATSGGQVSLTVSSAGKVSGKATGDGLAYTLAAPYYSGFTATSSEEGVISNFWADVSSSWSYKDGTKTVKTNDVVRLFVHDNAIGGCAEVEDWFEAYTANWKVEPWKTLGKTFDKQTMTYAILNDGTCSDKEEDVTEALGERIVGKVALKFTASGAITTAGEFVSGFDTKKQKFTTVKATGSATLVPVTSENGLVFVYLTPKGLPMHVRCLEVSLSGK